MVRAGHIECNVIESLSSENLNTVTKGLDAISSKLKEFSSIEQLDDTPSLFSRLEGIFYIDKSGKESQFYGVLCALFQVFRSTLDLCHNENNNTSNNILRIFEKNWKYVGGCFRSGNGVLIKNTLDTLTHLSKIGKQYSKTLWKLMELCLKPLREFLVEGKFHGLSKDIKCSYLNLVFSVMRNGDSAVRGSMLEHSNLWHWNLVAREIGASNNRLYIIDTLRECIVDINIERLKKNIFFDTFTLKILMELHEDDIGDLMNVLCKFLQKEKLRYLLLITNPGSSPLKQDLVIQILKYNPDLTGYYFKKHSLYISHLKFSEKMSWFASFSLIARILNIERYPSISTSPFRILSIKDDIFPHALNRDLLTSALISSDEDIKYSVAVVLCFVFAKLKRVLSILINQSEINNTRNPWLRACEDIIDLINKQLPDIQVIISQIELKPSNEMKDVPFSEEIPPKTLHSSLLRLFRYYLTYIPLHQENLRFDPKKLFTLELGTLDSEAFFESLKVIELTSGWIRWNVKSHNRDKSIIENLLELYCLKSTNNERSKIIRDTLKSILGKTYLFQFYEVELEEFLTFLGFFQAPHDITSAFTSWINNAICIQINTNNSKTFRDVGGLKLGPIVLCMFNAIVPLLQRYIKQTVNKTLTSIILTWTLSYIQRLVEIGLASHEDVREICLKARTGLDIASELECPFCFLLAFEKPYNVAFDSLKQFEITPIQNLNTFIEFVESEPIANEKFIRTILKAAAREKEWYDFILGHIYRSYPLKGSIFDILKPVLEDGNSSGNFPQIIMSLPPSIFLTNILCASDSLPQLNDAILSKISCASKDILSIAFITKSKLLKCVRNSSTPAIFEFILKIVDCLLLRSRDFNQEDEVCTIILEGLPLDSLIFPGKDFSIFSKMFYGTMIKAMDIAPENKLVSHYLNEYCTKLLDPDFKLDSFKKQFIVETAPTILNFIKDERLENVLDKILRLDIRGIPIPNAELNLNLSSLDKITYNKKKYIMKFLRAWNTGSRLCINVNKSKIKRKGAITIRKTLMIKIGSTSVPVKVPTYFPLERLDLKKYIKYSKTISSLCNNEYIKKTVQKLLSSKDVNELLDEDNRKHIYNIASKTSKPLHPILEHELEEYILNSLTNLSYEVWERTNHSVTNLIKRDPYAYSKKIFSSDIYNSLLDSELDYQETLIMCRWASCYYEVFSSAALKMNDEELQAQIIDATLRVILKAVFKGSKISSRLDDCISTLISNVSYWTEEVDKVWLSKICCGLLKNKESCHNLFCSLATFLEHYFLEKDVLRYLNILGIWIFYSKHLNMEGVIDVNLIMDVLLKQLALSNIFGDVKPLTNHDNLIHMVRFTTCLASISPLSVFKAEYLEKLVEIYNGSLSTLDTTILKFFYFLEKGNLSISRIISSWKSDQNKSCPIKSIDCTLMSHTIELFDINMKLEVSTDADHTILKTQHYSRYTSRLGVPLYDARFIIPFVAGLISAPNNTPNASLLRSILESNVLGLAFLCCSSLDSNMVKAGYYFLDIYQESISKSPNFWEMGQMRVMIDSIRNTISGPDRPRIPTLITFFISQSLSLLLKPDNEMYEPVNSFFLKRVVMDIHDVPIFYEIMNSDNNGRLKRIWLMHILLRGIRSHEDYPLYKRRKVFDIIMSSYDSPIYDKAIRKLILNLFKNICGIKELASHLFLTTSLGTFIELQALKSLQINSREKETILNVSQILYELSISLGTADSSIIDDTAVDKCILIVISLLENIRKTLKALMKDESLSADYISILLRATKTNFESARNLSAATNSTETIMKLYTRTLPSFTECISDIESLCKFPDEINVELNRVRRSIFRTLCDYRIPKIISLKNKTEMEIYLQSAIPGCIETLDILEKSHHFTTEDAESCALWIQGIMDSLANYLTKNIYIIPKFLKLAYALEISGFNISYSKVVSLLDTK